MKSNRRPIRLSLAIGEEAVTAIVVGQARPWVIERAPLNQVFASIERMLAPLNGGSGKGAVVDIAIMPSLCDVRLINLPPMRSQEAEMVIGRDAGRYFTVSQDARVIGVLMPQRMRATAIPEVARPVMAVSVPQHLLNEIAAAAAQQAWSIRRIVPAHAAWLRAATMHRTREDGGRARAFVATEGAHTYIARIEHGSPVQLRRIAASSHAAVAAAAGAGPGTAVLFGDNRGPVTAAMSAAGWSVLPADADGATAAAMHAAESSMELVSDAHHAARAARQRTLTTHLLVAAAVLAIASAAVAYWGARRELQEVRSARAAIRAQVRPLLALRDSIERLDARVRETDELFAGGARWSRTLYEVSVLLPRDAHLTRINATGDTIVIEAEGERAGDALEALRRAPTLKNVQMDGPVQRELEAGATAKERYALQATLASALSDDGSPKRKVQPSPRSVTTPTGLERER